METGTEYLNLSQAAKLLPPSPKTGKHPHTAALWRWIISGVDGVKLPAARFGHSWVLKKDDLEAFGKMLAEKSLAKLDKPPRPCSIQKPRTDARRDADIQQAKNILRREGCLK